MKKKSDDETIFLKENNIECYYNLQYFLFEQWNHNTLILIFNCDYDFFKKKNSFYLIFFPWKKYKTRNHHPIF